AFILGMSNVCPSDHDDNVVFFTALKKIMQQNGNVFLLLTGTDKNYINEIGLTQLYSDRIIFPGWTTFELYNKYMSSCNAFVLPFTNTIKNNGRWPNKIGDYLCLNRPIITNPTGDMMPLFTKYKIGFLCDDSEDGFYNVVTEILGRNKSLTEYHSDSIYVARQILSFDKRVNRLLEIIEGRLDLKS
ncbi:MAG: glycosyltransferase, partial [Proteobacteria bacterium]|nr:glycosyltransferase [Pseudomonadota bacterium]